MRNRFMIAALVAALVGSALPGAAGAAPQAGEVLALIGACFVESGGRKEPLKLGDPVHVGDAVAVGAGAKLKLRMNDGSVIALAADSRVTIADNRGGAGQGRDTRLSLDRGLLRALVPSLDGSSHFEVETATGVAAVRGTDWFIEARPGSTQVGVLAGRVGLKSAATGHEVVIPARWGARLEAGRDPVPPRLWSQAEFDAFIGRTNIAY